MPRTYINCSEGVSQEEITNMAKQIEEQGWQFCSLVSDHDAMIIAPQELTKLLLEFV